MNFIKKFQSFLKISKRNLYFSSNSRKIKAGCLKFCREYANIMHFCYFRMTAFQIFSKISQTIVFFVKTRENLTQGFEIFLKIDQNNAFFAILKRNFGEFSQNIPKQLRFSSKRANI